MADGQVCQICEVLDSVQRAQTVVTQEEFLHLGKLESKRALLRLVQALPINLKRADLLVVQGKLVACYANRSQLFAARCWSVRRDGIGVFALFMGVLRCAPVPAVDSIDRSAA